MRFFYKFCYFELTFIIPTSPPATHENIMSSTNPMSAENDFAKIEKLTNAKSTYNSPKIMPLIKPLLSPLIAMLAPTATDMVFIAKFIGEMYLSSSENHFSDSAKTMMSANEITIEIMRPFKKFKNVFLLKLSDFEKDIFSPL